MIVRPPRYFSSAHHRLGGLFCDSQQIVGSRRHEGRHLRLRLPNESRLPHATYRFQPAEDFFHSFAFSLADLIALGAGGAPSQSRGYAPVESCDVWPDLVRSQMLDKFFDVVTLVRTQGLGMNATAARCSAQVEGVTRTSTHRPLRFSMRTWAP